MTTYHKDKSTEIHNGDCLQVLRTFPDSSVDACVTDPPYGLAFMGKRWDYDVPAVEVWQEVLRVLKPGGHLLAFAGTRTQHRMAVRIEDAGFEIRDMIAWVYGSGFSKGFNLSRVDCCECGANPIPYTHTVKEGANGKSQTEHNVSELREANLSTAERIEEKRHSLLQSHMQQQAAGVQSNAQARSDCQTGKEDAGREQSGMEGWGVHRAGQGLSNDPQSEASTGEAERVCAGTHTGGGTNAGQATAGRRGGSSYQPQQSGQQAREPASVQQSPGTLDAGALQGRGQCERCGKLKPQFKGWSSNLKPALEPITVARAPLSGTVAANVLEHGTGAINVDGCRVGPGERVPGGGKSKRGADGGGIYGDGAAQQNAQAHDAGRFPANLIHDGSDEVVGLFPETGASNLRPPTGKPKYTGSDRDSNAMKASTTLDTTLRGHNDAGGSAARFFYCAKADAAERRNSKHPTVKPVALMRYLVRLVCPAGGVVLDPFAGSGTTIEAARLEHCRAIGIEREAEYCADILERLRQGVLF